MQRVNQAVGSVSPHLAPGDLQSDGPAARDHHQGDAPHANVRRLYNEVFLPRMREHLQAGAHSGPSSGAPASQKADALKKVCIAYPAPMTLQQRELSIDTAQQCVLWVMAVCFVYVRQCSPLHALSEQAQRCRTTCLQDEVVVGLLLDPSLKT